MVKLYLLLIAVASAFYWLKINRDNISAKSSSKKQIKKISAGRFDEVKAGLDILIRCKPYSEQFNPNQFYQRLVLLKGRMILDKYSVLEVAKNDIDEFIIISNAKVKDLIPTKYGNEYTDRFYPCSLYIKQQAEEMSLAFYSFFPQDKEHQFLLEDLADEVYNKGI